MTPRSLVLLGALALAGLGALGCQMEPPADPPPFAPFGHLDWRGALPSDDEIVADVAGFSGTPDDIALARAAARDILVPELHRRYRRDEGAAAARWLRVLARDRVATGRDLARAIIAAHVQELAELSTIAAERALHDQLGFFAPGWDAAAATALADPSAAASDYARDLDRLDDRWGALVDHSRAYYVAQNALRVACDGDYRVTAGVLYRGLVARGIPTRLDRATEL